MVEVELSKHGSILRQNDVVSAHLIRLKKSERQHCPAGERLKGFLARFPQPDTPRLVHI